MEIKLTDEMRAALDKGYPYFRTVFTTITLEEVCKYDELYKAEQRERWHQALLDLQRKINFFINYLSQFYKVTPLSYQSSDSGLYQSTIQIEHDGYKFDLQLWELNLKDGDPEGLDLVTDTDEDGYPIQVPFDTALKVYNSINQARCFWNTRTVR